jgi:hypothetical protein
MKTIFKYGLVIVFMLSISMALASPSYAQATETSTTCARINTRATNAQIAVTEKTATMTAGFTTRIQNIDNRPNTIDAKINEKRIAAATKFDAKIKKLLSTAKDASQKQAVTTFQTQVKQAEKTRETATDQARFNYRAELTKVVQAHQDALTEASAAYNTSVGTAFSAALTSCQAGGEVGALATLKTDIKTARGAFKTSREASKTNDQVKALVATRDTEIKTADDSFAQALKEYTTALDQAL